MSLDYSKIINRMENLHSKLLAFEKVCGGGLIHNTRLHLNLTLNWLNNFEYYNKLGDRVIRLYKDNTLPMELYTPNQEQLDAYFDNILDKVERFLADNITEGEDK